MKIPNFRLHAVLPFMAMLMLTACAHLSEFITPPQVEVASLQPQYLNPQEIGFIAKLAVTNQMPIRLPLSQVAFKVAVNKNQFLAASLNQLPALGAGATQMIDVPFSLKFQEVYALASQLPKQSTLRFDFNGELFLSQELPLPPIPFHFTLTLPKPHLPKISFAGLSVMREKQTLGIKLNIENPNQFPINLQDLNCALQLNQKPYSLLALNHQTPVAAGSSTTLQLQLGESVAQTASLVAQVLLGGKMAVQLDGQLKSDSPYGQITLPFNSQGKSGK